MTRDDLAEAVEDAHARYISAHGAYWNAMRFSAPCGIPTRVGSWPKPCCPTSTDKEKVERRSLMERMKEELAKAEAALTEFDRSQKKH